MSSAIRARLRLRSLRARLTFWYLLTLGTSLAAFGLVVLGLRARTIYREIDADLEVRTHQLARDLRPALLALDIGGELSAGWREVPAAVTVRETPDHIVFRSRSFPTLDWTGERTLTRAARDTAPLVTVRDRAGVPVRVATLAVDRPGAEPCILQVATSTRAARRALTQLAGLILVSILFVVAIATYGSGVTAHRALAPVDEIVRRVRHIQATRLGDRLHIQAGSDEIDRLVATLNDMLDRIEASVQTARRFAADASHELQTPLAAMRGIAEMGLRRERGPFSDQAMAADLLGEIERLSALVRDLRLLSLAEAGHLIAERVGVDLAALSVECGEIGRAIAEDKRIEVQTFIHSRPVVLGSPVHLRRVILNLVENAIRYSPEGSHVSLSLDAADGEVTIAVRDEGCGIESTDLPHIFEPFYRADPARARATGGSGLGLAIVDQIVRAHRGRVDVKTIPGAGSTFVVHLPLTSGGLQPEPPQPVLPSPAGP